MKRLALFILAIVALAYFVPIHAATSPELNNEPTKWTKLDSKAYARDVVSRWEARQWKCLDKLWEKESNWRKKAYNPIKVMGKNAGGIPQLLGLSPKSQPTEQIERGWDYIEYRYGTPCNALRFHEKNWWY